MGHDPLSPREAARTPLGIALILCSLLTFVYSLVIVAQVLVGLWSIVVLAGAYLTYRGLAVADSIADAAQRYAAVKEHGVDLNGDDAPREAGVDSAGEPTRRLTEREE